MKNKEKEETYECEECGATSDKPESCCGKPMKKVSHAGHK
jgi:hypothetical protein